MSASGTWHNLSRKPGPTALNCALKDMTGCFVLPNKAEITMVKITLIKSILKHTSGLIFCVEELGQIATSL